MTVEKNKKGEKPMLKGIKRIGIIAALTLIVLGGIFTYNHFFGKVNAEEEVEMTLQEQIQFKDLEKVKIITLADVKGAFDTTALKVTGFEEYGRIREEKITDVYKEKSIDKNDSFVTKKAKEMLNSANTREMNFTFSVDYGLGFDMRPLLQNGITVDEYEGVVTFSTPELIFTNFYIDPTYELTEENGVFISMLDNKFSSEEKSLLIRKMEDSMKKDIMEDERITEAALHSTKNQITQLIQEINPAIVVEFK